LAWSFEFSFLDQIVNAFRSTLTELASADLEILQELCDTAHKEARRRGVAEKKKADILSSSNVQ
jgi:50S ribosomal subunit-associated GTPase HflX